MQISNLNPDDQPNYAPDDNDQYRNTQYEKFQDGKQGVDKAPGEEPARGNSEVTEKSQKGKKVDGDPSQPADQPAE